MFNLPFLCRSGGGGGEESEGRTVVEVTEEGGERERERLERVSKTQEKD